MYAVCVYLLMYDVSCVLFTVVVVFTWCAVPFYAGTVRIMLGGLATSWIATQVAVSPQYCRIMLDGVHTRVTEGRLGLRWSALFSLIGRETRLFGL